MMELGGFISGTQLVDAILALTVLECIAVWAYHRVTGRGLAPRDYALNMLSGLFLMLALRSSLANAGPLLMAASLAAAGLAHGADMTCRWRRQRRES